MRNDDEEARVQANLEVIRAYLLDQFKGLTLTRDHLADTLYHWFTVTNETTGAQYTLKVERLPLGDMDSPGKIERQLATDNIADKMRTAGKNGYAWGSGMSPLTRSVL